jgi:hypothetical protein
MGQPRAKRPIHNWEAFTIVLLDAKAETLRILEILNYSSADNSERGVVGGTALFR